MNLAEDTNLITITQHSTPQFYFGQIYGGLKDLLKACEEAFEQLRQKYQTVMNMKIKNACPMDKPD